MNGKKRILVIQTAFIGDAILTLPMLQKLKELYPENSIDVLTIPSTEEIFNASPAADEVIVMDKRGKHKSIISLLRLIKELKKNNYKYIFAPHRSLRTSLITMLLGVRETFGFSSNSIKHVYKNLIEYHPEHHEVQRNLDLIGYKYEDDNWRVEPKIKVPSEAKQKVNNFLSSLNINDKLCAVAPGSVWNTKKYPIEYYEEVIKYFVSKNYTVIVIGGKSDEDICRNLAIKFNGSVISAAGKFSIVESIELLKNVEFLISNDSAPTHLGMCAGIAVAAIYCSTVPDFGFYPYNRKSVSISYKDLFCKPCGIHGYAECPIKTFECGFNLKPETVIKEIEEMINVST